MAAEEDDVVGLFGRGGSEVLGDFEADAAVGAGDEDDGFVGVGSGHDEKSSSALAGDCSVVWRGGEDVVRCEGCVLNIADFVAHLWFPFV